MGTKTPTKHVYERGEGSATDAQRPLDRLVMQLPMPDTDGVEISPGVFLIGSPTPRPDLGDNKMVCLANVGGALCTVELAFKFKPAQRPR